MRKILRDDRRIAKVSFGHCGCPKIIKFIFSHNLRMHYDGKVVECHCGSVYKTAYMLKVHQRTHSIGTAVNCKVCQKEFSKIELLKLHWKRLHLKTHGVFAGNEGEVFL